MKLLSATRRQITLAVRALGITAIAFVLISSSLPRFRGCPAELDATPKPTASSDDPHQLSLLLYNAQLRPRLLFSTSQLDRIQKLFPLIEGYDVLILTEGFDDYVLSTLQARYPSGYLSAPLGQNEGLSQDSGLFVFSQWPIVLKTQHHKVFETDCTGNSCFNYQGIVAVGIQKDSIETDSIEADSIETEQTPIYHLITAQLQAGNSNKAQSIRQEQYEQIRDFIKREIPETEPAIFAASLPISPQSHADEYEQMIATIGLVPLEITGKQQYSFDKTDNTLAKSDIPQNPDALFTLAQSAQQPQVATLQIRPMRVPVEQGWRSSPLLYWQCPQQNLSDHHAVEGQFNYEFSSPEGIGRPF